MYKFKFKKLNKSSQELVIYEQWVNACFMAGMKEEQRLNLEFQICILENSQPFPALQLSTSENKRPRRDILSGISLSTPHHAYDTISDEAPYTTSPTTVYLNCLENKVKLIIW